jgi:hypothetical protein
VDHSGTRICNSRSTPTPPDDPGAPPPNTARTCGGEPFTFATRYGDFSYSDIYGCAWLDSLPANSETELKQCARAKYGERFEETVVELRIATTGPNGCASRTITAGDEDEAIRCANSYCGVGCESEVGECP